MRKLLLLAAMIVPLIVGCGTHNLLEAPGYDRTPPATIELRITAWTLDSITLNWVSPGDSGTLGTATEYDLRYSTTPITLDNWRLATRVTGEPAPAVAGTTQSMTVSGLTSGITYFFCIKTRDDESNWSDFSNPLSAATMPDTTPPAAVVLSTGSVTLTTIVLTWTAPGDDSASGTATEYDIRYSTAAITTENWDSATLATGEPAPHAAGTGEMVTVTDLVASTTYFFAIKTRDEASNWSGLSNVATGATSAPDTVAPAAVVIATGSVTVSTAVLTWTAPGDDGVSGTALEYDVRYSTAPITTENWGSATLAAGEPTPHAAGTAETFTVTGLAASTTYYFAIKTRDEVSNWSDLSNVATVATAAVPDVVAPAAAVLSTGSVTATTVVLMWAAPGDDGAFGAATEYDVRYSTATITAANWGSATMATGEPTPHTAGTAETFTVTSLAVSTTYYFAIKTRDEVLNWSIMSNIATGTTSPAPDNVPPGAVVISIGSLASSTVVLNWSAPGDDGAVGTAAEYDIRYSTAAITAANWASATQAVGEPAPHAAGTAETFTVSGLAASTAYWFAIKTRDEVSNWSSLSNVSYVTTAPLPDTTAPSAAALLVDSVTPSSVVLKWSAPGDDGASGTATAYDIRYSTSSITAANWVNAAQLAGAPAPQAGGTAETFAVTGLQAAHAYYFALKTRDEAYNWSGMSNVVVGTTSAGAANVGVYFDAAGMTGSGSYAAGQVITAYLIMKECPDPLGIDGWECKISAPANVTMLSSTISGPGSINVGVYPEFIVGHSSPIAQSPAMVLATVTYMSYSSATGYFNLVPTATASIPNAMGYGPVSAPGTVNVMVVNRTPSATINPPGSGANGVDPE